MWTRRLSLEEPKRKEYSVKNSPERSQVPYTPAEIRGKRCKVKKIVLNQHKKDASIFSTYSGNVDRLERGNPDAILEGTAFDEA